MAQKPGLLSLCSYTLEVWWSHKPRVTVGENPPPRCPYTIGNKAFQRKHH